MKDKKESEHQAKRQIYNALKEAKDAHDQIEANKDGDYASDIPMEGEKRIRTKIGEDGVEETHVTYVPGKNKIRMGPMGKAHDKIDWDK